MKCKRSKLNQMFIDLGAPEKKVVAWTDAAMLGRIKVLPAKVEAKEIGEAKTQESQDLLMTILTNLAADDTIEITPDGKAEETKATGKGSKKSTASDKAGKNGKAETTAKKPTAKKKGGDWYGSRPGTGTYKINATLSKKPQDLDTIATASGVAKSNVASHLRTLMTKQLVEKTENGYKRV